MTRSWPLIVCLLCAAGSARAQSQQATDADAPKARSTSSTFGIVTTLAGVALAGGGVYFAMAARSDADKVAQHRGPWDAAAQQLEDSGKRNDAIGTTLIFVGGAAIVTGGLFWLLGGSSGERVEAAAAPMPGGFSLALTGRF
jgi:hypothetical protein